MRPWSQRSSEEAYLLNPAFCCLTLSSAIARYSEIQSKGLPYPLSLMVLPIVLHKDTSELLPRSSRTSMPTWVQENTRVRILFGERVISLKPYTNEAILFGFNHQWINIDQHLSLQLTQKMAKITSHIKNLDDSTKKSMKNARLIGEWFAEVTSVPTIMSLWGIRP